MEEFINEVEKITRGFSIEFAQTDYINAIYGKSNARFSNKDFAVKYMEFVNKYIIARNENTSEERAFQKLFSLGKLNVEEMELVKRRLDELSRKKENEERE